MICLLFFCPFTVFIIVYVSENKTAKNVVILRYGNSSGIWEQNLSKSFIDQEKGGDSEEIGIFDMTFWF